MARGINKVYSFYRDDFLNCFYDDEVDTVLQRAKEDNHQFVFIGDKDPIHFDNFLDIDSILENMQQSAINEYGHDLAESYLDSVTSDQKEELRKLINKWADKNNIAPRFFNVENIKPISIVDLQKEVNHG